ncbi:MAG: hypothetical protein K9G46_06965 [Flavobacteriales bacterium]|nr:hypothetical protein [Flavobacteriales bacterium]
MRKKEDWMKRGAKVLALGEPGTITKMQENSLDGVDYVYYIHVKLDNGNYASPYHPSDIEKA